MGGNNSRIFFDELCDRISNFVLRLKIQKQAILSNLLAVGEARYINTSIQFLQLEI